MATVYAIVLIGLAILAPRFYRGEQVRATIVGNAPALIAAVGMTLVILARQIDISVGSQFSVCAVVAGLLARAGLPMPAVGLGTIAAGVVMGAANGWLVAYGGLPSIVVTLASLVVYRESLRYLREGEFVRDLPADFQWFGLGNEAGPWFVAGIAGLVFLAFAWGLRHLRLGRVIYATGSDPEAARLVGIRPRRVVLGAFATMGGLAGLAALLDAVRFATVDPNAGLGMEMKVIAAVVVGGTAISGGRGNLAGTFVGVALLGTVGPALVHLHVRPEWERAIQGAIILLAVATDVLDRKGR